MSVHQNKKTPQKEIDIDEMIKIMSRAENLSNALQTEYQHYLSAKENSLEYKELAHQNLLKTAAALNQHLIDIRTEQEKDSTPSQFKEMLLSISLKIESLLNSVDSITNLNLNKSQQKIDIEKMLKLTSQAQELSNALQTEYLHYLSAKENPSSPDQWLAWNTMQTILAKLTAVYEQFDTQIEKITLNDQLKESLFSNIATLKSLMNSVMADIPKKFDSYLTKEITQAPTHIEMTKTPTHINIHQYNVQYFPSNNNRSEKSLFKSVNEESSQDQKNKPN